MEIINISNPNDGLGDKVRNAFNKVNLNFQELLDLISTIEFGANISDIVGLQSALDVLQNQTDIINSQMIILQTNIDNNNINVADALSQLSDINTALLTIADDFIPTTQKGVVNGVATLDDTGKIPSSQLPALSGVVSVAGKTGVVVLDKNDVGLNLVDNVADLNKVVLSASKLKTARTINGVSFDGTSDIMISTGAVYTASDGINISMNNITPRYGSSLGTIAQGNDLRIENGNQAFGWGDHRDAGYITSSATYTAGTNINISGNVISGAYNVFSTGNAGLVPARVGALSIKYLREDGTWVTPTNTTYAVGTKALLDAGTSTTSSVYSPLILNQWMMGKTTYYGFGLNAMDSGFIPTDLNTIMNTSILGFNAPSNSPYAYGSVWTHRRNSGECNQIVIDTLSDNISFRRQHSGTFNPWRTIYHDGNLTPLEIEAVSDFNAPNGFKILYGSASSASNTPLGNWTNGIQFQAASNNDYFNQLVFDINGKLFKRTKTAGTVGTYEEIMTKQTDFGWTTLATPGLNVTTAFTTKHLKFKIYNGFYIIDGEFFCNGSGTGTHANSIISEALPQIDKETLGKIALDDYMTVTSTCFNNVFLENDGTGVFLRATFKPNVGGITKFRVTLPIAIQ